MPPSYWEQAKSDLSAADPVLARLISEYHGESLSSRRDAFYTLARAIVGQQVSVKSADAMWARFEALVSPLNPQQTLAATNEAVRSCGFSRQKSLYVKEIARFFIEKSVNDAFFAQKSDDEVMEALISIKGVGKWTAEMFLIFHLQRPDILPIDDIGLQRAVEKHYFREIRQEKSAIMSKAEIWRPWRTVATWYLWRALDPVPVAY